MNSRAITIAYSDKVDIRTIQRVLEIFINVTPTGELRNKLCDANLETILLIKQETDMNTKDSPALQSVEQYERDLLLSLLIQCTEPQQLLFKRMYSHSDLTLSIEKVVEQMPFDKLHVAIRQCENTITSNKQKLEDESTTTNNT